MKKSVSKLRRETYGIRTEQISYQEVKDYFEGNYPSPTHNNGKTRYVINSRNTSVIIFPWGRDETIIEVFTTLKNIPKNLKQYLDEKKAVRIRNSLVPQNKESELKKICGLS